MAIYQTDPTSSHPRFREEGRLTLGADAAVGHPAQFHLDESVAVILTLHAIFIWNWVTGTGCTWQVEGDEVNLSNPVRISSAYLTSGR